LLIDESINFVLIRFGKHFYGAAPMPKLGMEPIRKEALVKATIVEIGRVGSLDVTVSQIAKRAGMSSALAHHYFGSKEDMFLAAMRHILTLYGAEVRGALAAADGAEGAEGRIRAILRANFSPGNFRREAVSAWLTFWVLAQTAPQAKRLLAIYQGRLKSNLIAALRPIAGDRSPAIAESLGALIDGLYLREVLKSGPPDGGAAVALALRHLEAELQRGTGHAC
jgi:TetR/AcrR family transcriptional regulator, transcriptional repressor of bet genes